jgi:hypothetical protein
VQEFSHDFSPSPSIDETHRDPGHFISPLKAASKKPAQNEADEHANDAAMPII